MSETPKELKGQTLFTPIHPCNLDQPKTWASSIGMLDWDNDKIVFSKRSLLEFLKTCQVSVNPNFVEIQKLPKYATFGRFSKAATDAAVADLVEAEIADPHKDSDKEESGNAAQPRTTRKVIDPPGGKQSIKLYGDEYEETDALSLAPTPDGGADIDINRMEHLKLHAEPEYDGGATIEDIPEGAKEAGKEEKSASNAPEGFRPTRRVRQTPGGTSTMGSILSGEP